MVRLFDASRSAFEVWTRAFEAGQLLGRDLAAEGKVHLKLETSFLSIESRLVRLEKEAKLKSML